MPIPLHVVVLAHPESPVFGPAPGGPVDRASLAMQLLLRLYGAPAALELRLPTWFGRATSDGSPPPLAECWGTGSEATLLVYLLDARMARRTDGGTGEAWGNHLAQAIADAHADPTHRSVVPLALDAGGFDVVPAGLTASVRKVAVETQLETILQHVGVRALYLLSGRGPPDEVGRMQVPIQVFVSHAKADLADAATDPVRGMLTALEEHAVERFFDSAKIGPGEDFEQRLEKEVRDSDVLLVVWTDAWSTRPWCRRELLTAKRAGRTVVVVDALQESSSRAFPYVGNATWVRWRGPSIPKGEAPSADQLKAAVAERLRVFTAVLLAAMRDRLERKALGDPPDARTVHLGSAPEALDFAHRPRIRTFVYPDPPLPDEERAVLASLSRGRSLLTPLGRIVRAGVPGHVQEVVVSVSSPGDVVLFERGFVAHHVDALTDKLHLGVLLAGLRIIYGGMLNYTSAGQSNFTQRLFDVVRRYGDLANILGRRWNAPVVNFPPWPMHLSYRDEQLNLFGRLASLDRAPAPDLAGLPYEPWATGAFPAINSVPRLVAVGLGLREMRLRATQPKPGAPPRPRIVVGGPLVSMGWLPGLVEEALHSLRLGAPLYLIGAYGGAAAVVAELLQQGRENGPAVMTEDSARATIGRSLGPSAYDDARALATNHGLPFDTREGVAVEIAALGQRGLAVALNNGLTDDENRELIRARDGRRVLELVLRGLTALPQLPPAPST